MEFYPGFPIESTSPPNFRYGEGVVGPAVEIRTLDSIRASLLDPRCDGPGQVYAIAMDVGMAEDLPDLRERMLLYGAVTYAKGRLGREPVRSQGHIHAVSACCGSSTPEVYEIWEGEACILMQESARDDPGRCFAVHAWPGEVVVVPPGWAHATISADPERPLAFGAWCVRDYAFDYGDVRTHGGLAFFPLLDETGGIRWQRNTRYTAGELIEKTPESYLSLGLRPSVPIYTQYRENRDAFLFVYKPQCACQVWRSFTP
jgi:glucose-6-phosphate isomerase